MGMGIIALTFSPETARSTPKSRRLRGTVRLGRDLALCRMRMQQLTLIHVPADGGEHANDPLHQTLRDFREFGEATREMAMELPGGMRVPVYVNEFWTSKQRAASRLHEVSYRACSSRSCRDFSSRA